MLNSDIPLKLPIPFASSAGGGYIRPIPEASQIGITDGAASLTDGFVPLNATPIGAGGVPPSIQDMNGILYEISGWSRWQAAGGPVYFDAAFAADIGGYPKGACLQSTVTDGVFWISTANGNTTDPDGGSAANWKRALPLPASGAETQAGSDATKFVTPAGLATLRATGAEMISGLTAQKFLTPTSYAGGAASAAEVIAGVLTNKYVTPASLAGFAQLLATNGYYDLPGGLRLAWGRFTAAANGTTPVSFAAPFPNQCFIVQAGGTLAGGDNSQDNNPEVVVSTITVNGFSVFSADDTNDPCCYFAIGY